MADDPRELFAKLTKPTKEEINLPMIELDFDMHSFIEEGSLSLSSEMIEDKASWHNREIIEKQKVELEKLSIALGGNATFTGRISSKHMSPYNKDLLCEECLWFRDGKLHRKKGPASVTLRTYSGDRSYLRKSFYLNGIKLTEAAHKRNGDSTETIKKIKFKLHGQLSIGDEISAYGDSSGNLYCVVVGSQASILDEKSCSTGGLLQKVNQLTKEFKEVNRMNAIDLARMFHELFATVGVD